MTQQKAILFVSETNIIYLGANAEDSTYANAETSLLKSYQGLIGRHYLTEKTITIRLCHRLHYGEHDPYSAPQPFNFTLAPHLALIPYPGSLDTITLWVCPTDEEFEAIAGHKLSPVPLGHIRRDLVAHLEKEFFEILANLDSKASKAHPKGKEYCTRIRILLSRLLSPATFQQALMTWRLAQRNCLELHTHVVWLSKVKPMFMSEHAWETHEVQSVIGAITDKQEVLEFCFRAGIPIWFYQAYKNETQWLVIEADQQVLKWLDKVEPPPTRPLPDYLSFMDNVPTHLTVFTGVIRASLECYQAMADYTWRIACPAAIFGADIVHNVSYDPNSQPAAEVVLPLPTSSVVPVRSSNSTSTSSGSSISTYNDGLRTSAK
ncbi:hypothetical protein BT96DRAFT_1003611 [Gymnopus androsaceus JB14]|uniref:Uncharacterized protein n=1 Tax=Gymnopus androsaceus JB14 TaxID=1447944 RepID=A0A6A4GVI0_9AGAR|nr:hypothetical protein BT96DRAFT_1003611 [Gymnopus androsaceus JB14]